MKFWHKIENAFKKIFGSTTWEKTASAVITYVAPLVETLTLLAAGGAAETIVARVVAMVQADLATVAAVVTGATATPPVNEITAVVNSLNSVKANLAGLLAAAEVKNATNAAKITDVANLIIGEAEAALQNVPTA